MRDGEMTAPGSLCTPHTTGQELFPPNLTGMDLLLSLALCQGSGRLRHMFPFLAFCSRAQTLWTPLSLTATVTLLHDFWTRTTSPRSLPPCLDATCLSLQGDTEPRSPPLTLRFVMPFQVIQPQSHQVLTWGSPWHPKCLLYPSMKVWERQTASQVQGFIPWQRPCHMTACAQRHSPPWLTTSGNKECQWMKSWMPSTHSFTGQAALNSNIHPSVKVQSVAHKKQQTSMPLLKSTYSLERDAKKMNRHDTQCVDTFWVLQMKGSRKTIEIPCCLNRWASYFFPFAFCFTYSSHLPSSYMRLFFGT